MYLIKPWWSQAQIVEVGKLCVHLPRHHRLDPTVQVDPEIPARL